MYEDSYDSYCDDLHDYSLEIFYEKYKRNSNFEDEKDQELFQVIVDNAEGTKGFFVWCDKKVEGIIEFDCRMNSINSSPNGEYCASPT